MGTILAVASSTFFKSFFSRNRVRLGSVSSSNNKLTYLGYAVDDLSYTEQSLRVSFALLEISHGRLFSGFLDCVPLIFSKAVGRRADGLRRPNHCAFTLTTAAKKHPQNGGGENPRGQHRNPRRWQPSSMAGSWSADIDRDDRNR